MRLCSPLLVLCRRFLVILLARRRVGGAHQNLCDTPDMRTQCIRSPHVGNDVDARVGPACIVGCRANGVEGGTDAALHPSGHHPKCPCILDGSVKPLADAEARRQRAVHRWQKARRTAVMLITFTKVKRKKSTNDAKTSTTRNNRLSHRNSVLRVRALSLSAWRTSNSHSHPLSSCFVRL
eukprot:SAG11_NODE_1383_length_5074_cov_41.695276_3_plen_180_part_00